jgi:peptide/nickel transport system substrate-binding protein
VADPDTQFGNKGTSKSILLVPLLRSIRRLEDASAAAPCRSHYPCCVLDGGRVRDKIGAKIAREERKMSRLVALAALALVALSPAASSAETPRRGGTLIYPITLGEPANYDCHQAASTSVLHRVAPHYSLLIKIDPQNYPHVMPDLAESWTISPDGLTYTFKIRDGVKFHDGSTLTAADIKATIDRIYKPPAGINSVRQPLYQDISSVEAPDPHTVTVHLSRRNAAMLVSLASPWNCVYSAAKLAQDPKYPERNVMGTGPFKFVEHIAGSEWRGTRFDDYFVKGKPYLDGFRAINIAPSGLASGMMAGQFQVHFTGVTRPERDRIAAARGDKIKWIETDATNVLVLVFNTTKPPFNDERVRRALNLAIDRDTGHKVIQKLNVFNRVGAYVRNGSEFAASPQEMQKFEGFGGNMDARRAEARRLLAEAGVPHLTATYLNRPNYSDLGVFLIDQWRQIGVTVTQELPENQRFFASQSGNQFDMTINSAPNFVDDPSVQMALYQSYSRTKENLSRSEDPKVDELFDKQAAAQDPAERKRYVTELQAYLLHKAYTIPQFWAERMIPVASEVHGYKATPSLYVGQDLADIWLSQ